MINILNVEDNSDDLLLIELALHNLPIKVELEKALNGKDAIVFLENKLKDKKKLPDLILLDINLPLLNGFEVLNKIKKNIYLSNIPIVFFTSSDSTSEMKYAYENGADLYIRKPNNLSGFKRAMLQAIQLVRTIEIS